MRLLFTVPGQPQPKQRARRGPSGAFYTPHATKAYEALVANYAAQAMAAQRIPKRQTCPVTIEVVYCRATRHRCDGDNILKAIKDALNHIAYEDDSQVRKESCERIDEGPARAEITVTWL